jgi:acetamidase/formamidase
MPERIIAEGEMDTVSSWIESSVMARRGVARGKAGARHILTEEKQGKFQYLYGPYADPVLHIKPGDVVEVETRDAYDGRIRTEADLPSKVLVRPYSNPQNGPIHVEGAVKGDVIAVHIQKILPRGAQPRGTTTVSSTFGGLNGTTMTPMLNKPLDEVVRKVVVTEEGIQFSDRIRLPFEPFLGTLGVSPQIEAVSSLQPDYWGGNMDVPDVAPNAIAYFPVHCEGGYVFLGDCHAVQGDGELAGAAIEIAAHVTIQIDLIKSWQIGWPRLETRDFIMAIGSARPMEDAARIAYRELIRWLVADYGFGEIEAYQFLTQAGKLRVGNMVDPKYSLGASVSKTYLQ